MEAFGNQIPATLQDDANQISTMLWCVAIQTIQRKYVDFPRLFTFPAEEIFIFG